MEEKVRKRKEMMLSFLDYTKLVFMQAAKEVKKMDSLWWRGG